MTPISGPIISSYDLTWHQVTEADGSERDEAVVERLRVRPVVQHHKHNGRQEQETNEPNQKDEQHSEDFTDLRVLLALVQFDVDEAEHLTQLVPDAGQQCQRVRDAKYGVNNTERLAANRGWVYVAIACNIDGMQTKVKCSESSFNFNNY